MRKNKINEKADSKDVVGRMSKQKEDFLSAYAACAGMISTACRKSKISRTTFYKWKSTIPAFAQKIQEIDDEQLDFAESKLMENIKEGNQRAIEFYLDRKGKNIGYGPKDVSSINIENTQKVEQKAIIKIGMRQTDREKELLKGKNKPK